MLQPATANNTRKCRFCGQILSVERSKYCRNHAHRARQQSGRSEHGSEGYLLLAFIIIEAYLVSCYFVRRVSKEKFGEIFVSYRRAPPMKPYFRIYYDQREVPSTCGTVTGTVLTVVLQYCTVHVQYITVRVCMTDMVHKTRTSLRF